MRTAPAAPAASDSATEAIALAAEPAAVAAGAVPRDPGAGQGSRTRRAVLVGALGGLAATVASFVRAPAVRAGVDGDLVLEATNTTDAQTELIADTSAAGFRVLGTGMALQGWGDIGVDAYGETIGVNAVGDGATAPAVVAYNRANGTGAFGWTTNGNSTPPAMPAKTGLYGLAEQDANARGVHGRTTSGQGVRGQATTGVGVAGVSTSGPAVQGDSAESIGVLGIGPLGFVPEPLLVKPGVYGAAATNPGVFGYSAQGYGVRGDSTGGDGIYGQAGAAQDGTNLHPNAGILNGHNAGVHGHGSWAGILGTNGDGGIGVWAQSTDSPAVLAQNTSASAATVLADGGPGTGVHGHAGDGPLTMELMPSSPAATAVYASAVNAAVGVASQSASGLAVKATSTAGHAIRGRGQLDGVIGESPGGRSGVVGYSGGGSAPAGPAKTGVYGEATQDAASRGVSGFALAGQGVRGEATSGSGVAGIATTGSGVNGSATTGAGVTGAATTGIGVRGTAAGGIGVQGQETAGRGVHGIATTGEGVRGEAGAGMGVHGVATTGEGVRGDATTGRAVRGVATAGQAVAGEATTGVGVRAVATTGVALEVAGRVTFSRSGRFTFPVGVTSFDVTVPGGLSSTAIVFAQLQFLRSGVYVLGARPNWPSAGKVRIYISKALTTATPMAWFVIG